MTHKLPSTKPPGMVSDRYGRLSVVERYLLFERCVTAVNPKSHFTNPKIFNIYPTNRCLSPCAATYNKSPLNGANDNAVNHRKIALALCRQQQRFPISVKRDEPLIFYAVFVYQIPMCLAQSININLYIYTTNRLILKTPTRFSVMVDEAKPPLVCSVKGIPLTNRHKT